MTLGEEMALLFCAWARVGWAGKATEGRERASRASGRVWAQERGGAGTCLAGVLGSRTHSKGGSRRVKAGQNVSLLAGPAFSLSPAKVAAYPPLFHGQASARSPTGLPIEGDAVSVLLLLDVTILQLVLGPVVSSWEGRDMAVETAGPVWPL